MPQTGWQNKVLDKRRNTSATLMGHLVPKKVRDKISNSIKLWYKKGGIPWNKGKMKYDFREISCLQCGIVVKFIDRPSSKNKKFCSRKCKDLWQKTGLLGRKNPWWKEDKVDNRGVSTEIKREIFKKFNGECICCGRKINLHVHHLTPFKECKSHKEENLWLLCNDCHREVHRGWMFLIPPKVMSYKIPEFVGG